MPGIKKWPLGRGVAFKRNNSHPYLRQCIGCRCWFDLLDFGLCANCRRYRDGGTL